MDRRILEEVIIQQRQLFVDKQFIVRDNVNINLKDNSVTVISGIRRCGKSTLLYQIRQNNKEKDYFINFDDERLLHFKVDDFQLLYESFVELYGKQSTFYFDEIQNIKNWERFVRRLHDYGNKIYITGSNATMLSRELGTHLTGRYIQTELYPFSFKEFLKIENIKVTKEFFFTTDGKAILRRNFSNYIKQGGFPEFILNNNTQYLKTLYDSILYRDVLIKNNLLNETELRELVYFIAGNIAKLVSYTSLSKIINVKHTQTVKQYLEYLQNTYLIFLVNKYDNSIKKQIYNPKKIYFIDNVLAKTIGFSFTENKGRFLENIVFLELKRRAKDVFYHKQKNECDFVIKEKNRIVDAIQVSWSVYNSETRKREVEGLLEALNTYNLSGGLILTDSEEEKLIIDGFSIIVKPVWKWLLEF